MKEKEKLDAKISFRLPQSVNAEWRKKAEESGMNLGDWIRGQIKLDGVKPVLPRKKLPGEARKLNRISRRQIRHCLVPLVVSVTTSIKLPGVLTPPL